MPGPRLVPEHDRPVRREAVIVRVRLAACWPLRLPGGSPLRGSPGLWLVPHTGSMLGDLPSQIHRPPAGSGGRHNGRNSAIRLDSTRIEFCQLIRSAITFAGIRGYACSNSRIRGSARARLERGGSVFAFRHRVSFTCRRQEIQTFPLRPICDITDGRPVIPDERLPSTVGYFR